jgi:hypothetical protein
MLASLRKTLVESHVAAVTVTLLLMASIQGFCCAAQYLVHVPILFAELAAHHRLGDFVSQLEKQDSYLLFGALSCLAGAAVVILCAWLVSRWAYGVGPLRSLAPYREKITRKFHA